MGVRPPSDDIDDEPDVVEFGIAALDAKLESREITFPIDAEELVDRHGDVSVPVDAAGHETSLASAVEATDRRRFDSEADLLEALHPVFEAQREAVSRSLVARLRGLLPI